MGLIGREGFFDSVNEGSSSSAKKKKKNTCCQTRVRADRMGPEAAAVFPESEVIEDDCDLGKRLDEESCNGENESLWLSSDCYSPASFFSEYRLYDWAPLSFDEWMISWLQVSRQLWFSSGKGIGFFDGSRINPIEEACLVLEKNLPDAEKILQEDLEEEEVVTWLLSSTENDVADSSSVIFSESSVSSFEESAGSESPSTPLITHLKPSFRGLDLDRTGFWVSLVDLDEEDFKWISDSGSVLDSLQSSDFPSPSYKTISSSGGSAAEDLEDFNTDELLFWPFEQKPDWSSGNWDCFSMSPRKNSYLTNAASGPHNRKTDPNEVSRRLLFTSGSTASKILEWKQRSNKKGVWRTSATPSSLSKPAKTSEETVPSDSDNNIIEPTEEKVLNQIFLEEFASNEELPIETLLGLDEFDGHEGVDLEFNKDDFFLDQAP